VGKESVKSAENFQNLGKTLTVKSAFMKELRAD